MTKPIFVLRPLLRWALALALTAGAAGAHSFNLLLVVPDDDTMAQDMLHAVLLAAEERDGHPDNHSDGHLGGLDVYVTLSSDLSAPGAWDEAQPDIVLDALLMPLPHDADTETDWLALNGTDLLGLERDGTLMRAANPDFAPFAARFRAATGRAPGPEASTAYLGARLIDLIVRPLDDAGSPEALRKQLDTLR